MNPSFKIESTDQVSANARLYLEIGLQRIVYYIIDRNDECIALHYYQLPASDTPDKIAGALKQLAAEQQLLQEQFKQVFVSYAFPVCIQLPQTYAAPEHHQQLLELVHGELNDVFIRTDFVPVQSLHNIYAVSRQMDAVINYLFAAPVSTHQFSLLPAMHNVTGNSLYCIFASGCVTAMLTKQGELQLIQSYSFSQPEDVAYWVLQICTGFESVPDDTTLYLSGLIDIDSKLFEELNKYFLQSEFTTLPNCYTYPEGIHEYPAHYFSHLFAAAQCV